MFTVVGGTYREVCLEPRWDQVYGSGLRAAAAVAEIIHEITGAQPSLVTWTAAEEKAESEARCSSYGILPTIHVRPSPIEFQWDHGLSIPRMLPPLADIAPVTPQKIAIDKGIYFGLLEDRPQENRNCQINIAAAQLVYDPQSESRALPWSKTGSTADRLAICANLAEVQAMVNALGISGSSDLPKPVSLGRALLVAERAEVVVVKCGAEGAFVVTNDDSHSVRSFWSRRVFPIGTGDIFSSVFAAYWAAAGADPVDAARRASAAAGYYSNCRALPIPNDIDELMRGLKEHRVPATKERQVRSMVYIAGPLFNFQERWFVEEVKRCLEQQGVRTFSPYHEVGMVSSDASAKHVYGADIAGLEDSKSVFAIIDGLDSGTMFEIGYAVAKGIPVVAFSQCTPKEQLTMLIGSDLCSVKRDFPTAIYHAAWKALES